MPAILAQVKDALGGASAALPAAIPGPSPAAGPSFSAGCSRSAPAPPIVVEETDSDDPDVQTLAVPFRSGISDTFLPMISTEESWSTDSIFRYYYFCFFVLALTLFAIIESGKSVSGLYGHFLQLCLFYTHNTALL